MPSSKTRHPADRRELDGLTFDATSGSLAIGSRTVSLGASPANRVVLTTYIDLVTSVRGGRVTDVAFLRDDDLQALAQALDLEAADLVNELAELLQLDQTAAHSLLQRLRESRLGGGLAKAALAGSLLVGGVALASCGTSGTTAPEAKPLDRPAATTTVAPAPTPKPHITIDENGVGLIDPLTIDNNGVGLVPPASVDKENN